MNVFRRRASPQPHLVPLVQSPKRVIPPPKILINSSSHYTASSLSTTLQSLPRFGPLYGENEEPMFTSMKEEAWKLVENSGPDKLVIQETYFSAMGLIEQNARNSYANGADRLTGSEFKWMMIKDGCFFLHLALLLLGASDHLGYPVDDGIFGRGRSNRDTKRWVKAILFAGNQVPVIVVKELMKQRYFQQVLIRKQGTWDEPRGVLRTALYDLLGLPPPLVTSSNNNSWFGAETTDLLHGLQCMVLAPLLPEQKTRDDLESGDAIFEIDEARRFRSAIEMEQAGIGFDMIRPGTEGIKFSANFFGACLYLPALLVDDDTEAVFQSLIEYENSQKVSADNRNKWGVCSYVRLMKDLVRAQEDLNLLEKRGVVNTSGDLKRKDNLPGILARLQGCQAHITPQLDNVRLLTTHYSSPAVWGNLKKSLKILITFLITFLLMFVLAFLQTYYTVYDHYNKADTAPPPPTDQH